MKAISLGTFETCTTQMFEVEVQMVGKIKHPNVGFITMAFQDESMLYLVMDDFTGGDLFDAASGL